VIPSCGPAHDAAHHASLAMDALSTPRKHFDTSGKSTAPFHDRAICKTPMALPDNGLARLQAKILTDN
jgi:hypothetical protein